MSVYIVYLVGCASFFNGERVRAVYVVPFFRLMEWYQVASALNWSIGIALVLWVAWGIQFVSEGR
jgi:hypothetical protein